MSINIAIRVVSRSNPHQGYRGLSVVTINGRDHSWCEPRGEALARVERLRTIIARMRAEGQSDATILGQCGVW